MAGDKDLITAQALAEALNLSVEVIRKYTREKKIPCVESDSRQYRYNLNDVINALAASPMQKKGNGFETEPRKKFTYRDYLALPKEPGFRYEVLEGVLVKDPSPNVAHQRVSRRLQRILEDYFWQADPEGEIFSAPLAVILQDVTVVQPDLFYISGEQKQIIKDSCIDDAPTLIVEILSLSTNRKDRLQKMQIYQKACVQHYWLVNPDEKTLECFQFIADVYALITAGMDEDVVKHPGYAGLSIDLDALW